MEMNNKKKHFSYIIVSFSILLFAMCLTMNVFFYGTHNLYELLDKTTITETWSIPASAVANEDSDNITYSKTLALNQNISNSETITKNTLAIPKRIGLFLCFTIVLLLFFLTLFISLPDRWTLIKQKVRLDN